MKIKLLATCEIQYFELGILSFNSYVYYLSRRFIASTLAFNLLTRAFNLSTCAFNLPTRAFNYATRAFSHLTSGVELVTRGFELVTRVLLFHSYSILVQKKALTEIPISLRLPDRALCIRKIKTNSYSSHFIFTLLFKGKPKNLETN